MSHFKIVSNDDSSFITHDLPSIGSNYYAAHIFSPAPEKNICAAGLGFEPRQTAPKAVVLPLHHPAIRDIIPEKQKNSEELFVQNNNLLLLRRHSQETSEHFTRLVKVS